MNKHALMLKHQLVLQLAANSATWITSYSPEELENKIFTFAERIISRIQEEGAECEAAEMTEPSVKVENVSLEEFLAQFANRPEGKLQ